MDPSLNVVAPVGEARDRLSESQEAHHRVRSFAEEYLDFLKQGGVEYDERFVIGLG